MFFFFVLGGRLCIEPKWRGEGKAWTKGKSAPLLFAEEGEDFSFLGFSDFSISRDVPNLEIKAHGESGRE